MPASPSGIDARAAEIPTGCLGLELGSCLLVRDMAVRQIGQAPAPIVYVRVGPFGCQDATPCPTNLGARPEGTVTIELNGQESKVVAVKAPGGQIQANVEPETFLARVEPTSAPMAGNATETELGHCGVGSGIDVDGSFWDPVGLVNIDLPDFINAAPARFTKTSPTTATLQTRGGLALVLARHEGSKYLELCD